MANQCSLIAQITLVAKKKRNKSMTNKQRKTKEKNNKQMKNWKINTYDEPLSKEWIGRRS